MALVPSEAGSGNGKCLAQRRDLKHVFLIATCFIVMIVVLKAEGCFRGAPRSTGHGPGQDGWGSGTHLLPASENVSLVLEGVLPLLIK